MNKKYFLSIAVLVFAIVGFSGFKTEVRTVDTWYRYNSSDQSISARQQASNYVRVSELPGTCSNGDDVCAIKLNQDFGTQPDFSSGKVTFNSSGIPNGGTAFMLTSKKPAE